MAKGFIYEYVLVSRSSCFDPYSYRVHFPKTCKESCGKTATALPIISVVAISLILASVVGGSKDQIVKTGFLIFLVVILHNVLGYTIGFVLAHIFKLERRDKKQWQLKWVCKIQVSLFH